MIIVPIKRKMADSQNTQILDQRVGIIDPLDADRSQNTWHRVTFDVPFAPETKVVVIPMTQTFVGYQTPGLRLQHVTNCGFEIRFDEVVGSYANLSDGFHLPETVGWVAYGVIGKQQEIPLESAKPTTGKDTKTASGRTTPGATNWQADSATGIYVDVDTSAAGFTKTPVYVTSIGGDRHHWNTTGGCSVYDPTATGFRVYIRWDQVSATKEELTPAGANGDKWHINWIGSEP